MNMASYRSSEEGNQQNHEEDSLPKCEQQITHSLQIFKTYPNSRHLLSDKIDKKDLINFEKTHLEIKTRKRKLGDFKEVSRQMECEEIEHQVKHETKQKNVVHASFGEIEHPFIRKISLEKIKYKTFNVDRLVQWSHVLDRDSFGHHDKKYQFDCIGKELQSFEGNREKSCKSAGLETSGAAYEDLKKMLPNCKNRGGVSQVSRLFKQ